MRRREEELAAAGARLVFVGPGTPQMAAVFAAQAAGDHDVLSDVGRGGFRAAGMRRSPWAALHWRSFRNALRAWRRGFRQARIQGDPWQQGGALVFSAEGALLHHQVDRAAGDELDLDALVAALS